MSGDGSEVDRASALRLWVILNRAVNSIGEVLSEQVSGHDLSYTEFAVLEVLLHKGALPIGEVGDQVLLTSGSMTYVIDKLEDRGLLHRRPCPDDRRVLYVELTDAGEDLITDAFDEHAALLGALMEVLDESEIREASEHIKRLGKHADSFSAESVS